MRHYKLLLVALAFLFACATDERDINISQSGATEKTDALDEQQKPAATTDTQDERLDFSNFVVAPQHPTIDCLNGTFDKFVNVFGMYVVATPEAPLDYVQHTANVLAQFLDNDEDGEPDDLKVHRHLVDGNFVVPVWGEEDREIFFEGARGTYCEDNVGFRASMYYDHDRWALGGVGTAGNWDTNLEEVWHVVSSGWYRVYPEHFGDAPGSSKLTEAMDTARGGFFIEVPSRYPDNAWYSYDDETCAYGCQVHEYFYWALMANIGALDPKLTDKCHNSRQEWHVCTAADLERTDPLVFDLLNNHGFELPTRIPDGSYQEWAQVSSDDSSEDPDAGGSNKIGYARFSEEERARLAKDTRIPDLAIMSQHPTIDCLNGTFDKFVNVFGMYVMGTPETPESFVNHSAGVLAQYLDNDEDGSVDDIAVLNFLVGINRVVPIWTQQDSETFYSATDRGALCEEKVSFGASMFLEDKWAFGGITSAGHWDTNLEEIWHIITKGFDHVYPYYFGARPGLSSIGEAVDAARGGRFQEAPDKYPDESWYRFYDPTCVYDCQIYEYFYWILMANIGALDPKYTDICESSKDEWPICTKAELKQRDKLAYELLNNEGFRLPTRIPDGNYQPSQQ